MIPPRRGFFPFALVALVMLAACGESPSDAGPAAPSSNKPVAPKADGLPSEMVAAVSAGNTSSVIGVHFALGATPVVNQPLPVEIAIVPHQEFASLLAHFDAQGGLAVTVGGTMDTVTSISPEKPIKHQLVLLPREAGVFMVTAVIDSQGQEGNMTRVFSIPVIVAAQAPPPASAPDPKPAATTSN
jgi:hypothetical protein